MNVECHDNLAVKETLVHKNGDHPSCIPSYRSFDNVLLSSSLCFSLSFTLVKELRREEVDRGTWTIKPALDDPSAGFCWVLGFCGRLPKPFRYPLIICSREALLSCTSVGSSAGGSSPVGMCLIFGLVDAQSGDREHD